MYQLFRAIPVKQLVSQEAPALFGSFVIAELFYKFHSFTFECLAFLATWLALSWLADRVANLLNR